MNVYSELMLKYCNELGEIHREYEKKEEEIYKSMKTFVEYYEKKSSIKSNMQILEDEIEKFCNSASYNE